MICKELLLESGLYNILYCFLVAFHNLRFTICTPSNQLNPRGKKPQLTEESTEKELLLESNAILHVEAINVNSQRITCKSRMLVQKSKFSLIIIFFIFSLFNAKLIVFILFILLPRIHSQASTFSCTTLSELGMFSRQEVMKSEYNDSHGTCLITCVQTGTSCCKDRRLFGDIC